MKYSVMLAVPTTLYNVVTVEAENEAAAEEKALAEGQDGKHTFEPSESVDLRDCYVVDILEDLD